MSPLNNRRLFSPPFGSPQRTELEGVSRCTHWARCVAESHKVLLSLTFQATLKGRMLKRLCTKETPLRSGGGAFIVSTGSGGEKGQPEAIPTCSGKAAWGTQAKESALQGGKPSGPGAKWGGRHPLGTSSHYTPLHPPHLPGDGKWLPTIHPKGQSLGNLVNKQNYGKRWTHFFLKQSLEKGDKNSSDVSERQDGHCANTDRLYWAPRRGVSGHSKIRCMAIISYQGDFLSRQPILFARGLPLLKKGVRELVTGQWSNMGGEARPGFCHLLQSKGLSSSS